MGITDAFFDAMRGNAFCKGADYLGAAEALEQLGHFGPAWRYYREAHEKFRFTADTLTFLQTRDRTNACLQQAESRGEKTSFALAPPMREIVQAPAAFVLWYYACQTQPRPWDFQTAVAEATAAEAHAMRSQRREEARQKAEHERAEAARKTSFQERAAVEMPQRWRDLVSAASRLADGDASARDEAVRLWTWPRGDDEDLAGAAWTDYGSRQLQSAVGQAENPTLSKALKVMPQIALAAKRSEIWFIPTVLAVGAPLTFGALCLALWVLVAIAPEQLTGACVLLYGLVVWLLILFVGLAGAIAGILVIPVTLVGFVMLLVSSLPNYLRARRAIALQDPLRLPRKILFGLAAES